MASPRRYTLARKGLSVIVAEPREGPIDKACGEGSDARRAGRTDLARCGPGRHAVPRDRLCERAPRAEARFRGGPGRGVRRTTLHAALAARAKEQDTEWIQTRVTSVEQDAHWRDGRRGAREMVGGSRRTAFGGAARGRDQRARPENRGATACAGISGCPRWSEFVEVHWSRWGEAYVTPVEPDLVGVAILSRQKTRTRLVPLAGPATARRRATAPARGCGPLRQVVSRRVAGRVLLVGDAAGL